MTNRWPKRVAYRSEPRRMTNRWPKRVAYRSEPRRMTNRWPKRVAYRSEPRRMTNRWPKRVAYRSEPRRMTNRWPKRVAYRSEPRRMTNRWPQSSARLLRPPARCRADCPVAPRHRFPSRARRRRLRRSSPIDGETRLLRSTPLADAGQRSRDRRCAMWSTTAGHRGKPRFLTASWVLAQHLDADVNHACAQHVELARGGFGEVDDAARLAERAAVGDTHDHRAIIVDPHHAHLRSEAQRSMRGGERAGVVALAAWSARSARTLRIGAGGRQLGAGVSSR
jgi:hypothetical protein